LVNFSDRMDVQRGVKNATLGIYQTILEEFILSLGNDPRSYSAETLRGFVLLRGSRHGISYAKLEATAVRAFIQFLTLTGQCPAGLAYAIPA
jgi:integrase/recombinase XerD